MTHTVRTPKKVHEDGRVQTQLRLDRELYDQLRKAADDRDVSVNWLICRALEDFLPRLIPPDEIRWTRE